MNVLFGEGDYVCSNTATFIAMFLRNASLTCCFNDFYLWCNKCGIVKKVDVGCWGEIYSLKV
jgi:hypothetical protein